MKKAVILLAEGFEEIEALTVVDILRRGGVEIDMVSVTDEKLVYGKNRIPVMADAIFAQTDFTDVTTLVLPGGIPGVPNLKQHDGVKTLVTRFMRQGRQVAAICAAPTLLGGWGLLEGRTITCYPGSEADCPGATVTNKEVVKDGNLITGRAMAAAIAFALEVLTQMADEDRAVSVAQGIVYHR
ncbi:MAG: DJ-1/PfpI family protein [Eubacteriales bacterium]|nr:DJ-1/PfpI family protein [Eubacteriales bacterium]